MISIIIPTYIAKRELSNCLWSLEEYSHFNNEVVIILDRVDDIHRAIAYNYKSISRHKYVIIEINKKQDDIYNLWYYGIESSNNDIMCHFNDDLIVGKDWDINMFKHLTKERIVGALTMLPITNTKCPKILNNVTIGFIQSQVCPYDNLDLFNKYIFEKEINRLKNNSLGKFPWVIPIMMHKETFYKCGGYTSKYHRFQDSSLFLGAKENGIQVCRSNDSLVRHFSGSTMKCKYKFDITTDNAKKRHKNIIINENDSMDWTNYFFENGFSGNLNGYYK